MFNFLYYKIQETYLYVLSWNKSFLKQKRLIFFLYNPYKYFIYIENADI